MKQPFVSIVTLNLDNEEYTIKCLNSLEKLNYPNYEVIIVDNGSHIRSFNIIKNYVKKLKLKTRLIRLEQNMGFAEGINIGVRVSKADYIATLDNDTVVDKNWLKEMVWVMKENKNTALVGSEVNSIGDFYKKGKTLGHVMSILGEPIDIKSKDKSFTFFVSGCSTLFRKSIVKEPYDKDYFAYGEDTALSWLVSLKGYKARIAYKSKLDHIGGAARKRFSKLVEFHGEKNRLMNLLLFYESKTLIKLAPLLILNVLTTLMVSIPRGMFTTRMQSYLWLVKNRKKVIEKRKRIQQQRRLSDKEIFKSISCHSPYTNNFIINNLLKLYCFVFRLPVLELRK